MINDFNVRVWGTDVFIHGKDVSYWGGEKGVGLQCNFEEGTKEYNDIWWMCEEIRTRFIKLNELTNKNNHG